MHVPLAIAILLVTSVKEVLNLSHFVNLFVHRITGTEKVLDDFCGIFERCRPQNKQQSVRLWGDLYRGFFYFSNIAKLGLWLISQNWISAWEITP